MNTIKINLVLGGITIIENLMYNDLLLKWYDHNKNYLMDDIKFYPSDNK